MVLKNFLSLSNITLLFPLHVRYPSTIKFLKDFLKLALFPLSFDISSGQYLFLTKFSIFLKSTCLLLVIFLKFIFNQKEKHDLKEKFSPKTFDFLFQKHFNFYSEKRVEISSCSSISKIAKCWWMKMKMNFLTGIFQGFCLLFRSTYLKEHLWVTASVYLNRKAAQGSPYFLGEYYSRDYFNVKMPHSKHFKGRTYFLEGVLIY